MIEAVRTSETSVDNHFTRQYNPEDNSELIRMDQGQMVKQLFDGQQGARRRSGRPRLRWLRDAEAESRTMGIRRWRLIAKIEWNGPASQGTQKPCKGP
jgi:hypothetical protein